LEIGEGKRREAGKNGEPPLETRPTGRKKGGRGGTATARPYRNSSPLHNGRATECPRRKGAATKHNPLYCRFGKRKKRR